MKGETHYEMLRYQMHQEGDKKGSCQKNGKKEEINLLRSFS
jgi:hypothetical protein